MKDVLKYAQWLKYSNIAYLVVNCVGFLIVAIIFIFGFILLSSFEYAYLGGDSGFFLFYFLILFIIAAVLSSAIFVPTILFIIKSGKFIKIAKQSLYSDVEINPELLYESYLKFRTFAIIAFCFQAGFFAISVFSELINIFMAILNGDGSILTYLLFRIFSYAISIALMVNLTIPFIKLLTSREIKQLKIEVEETRFQQ